MQFVLDDEVGRWQAIRRQRTAASRIAWSVEAVVIEALHSAEESAHRPRPGHGRKLVHRGDDEAWQAAIDRFVDRQNGQRFTSAKGAVSIDAG